MIVYDLVGGELLLVSNSFSFLFMFLGLSDSLLCIDLKMNTSLFMIWYAGCSFLFIAPFVILSLWKN